MYVKGNTIRPCPTVMEMWLICWHSTWSHGALRTFSSPSTTRAAAPRSSKLPGTTQLLCCSSLTLPTLPPTAGYHISILLFRGDRGTSSPSQEPKAAELQNPLIILALDPLSVLQRAWALTKTECSIPNFYQSLKMKLLFIRYQEPVTTPALFSPDNFYRL